MSIAVVPSLCNFMWGASDDDIDDDDGGDGDGDDGYDDDGYHGDRGGQALTYDDLTLNN